MNKNINILTQVGGSAAGVIGSNLAVACIDSGITTSLFPIGETMIFNDQDEVSACFKAIKNSRQFKYKAPCIKIWHSHEMAIRIGSGKYISMPILSGDYLTPTDMHHLNYTDLILVPSSWYIPVLEKHKINKPYHVINLGINNYIFADSRYERVDTTDKYIFYHIGKWDLKNSQDFIIKAFDKAFDVSDNVELRLLPHNDYIKEDDLNQWISLTATAKLKDKISVYKKLKTQYNVADFIKNSDCGLFLNRLPLLPINLLESMAMNKPIIALNYKAHTDYAGHDAFFSIDVKEESAYDGRTMFGNANWAKLDANVFDQTIHYMRYVYSNNIRNNDMGVRLTQDLSWKNTIKQIDSICTKISGYRSRS